MGQLRLIVVDDEADMASLVSDVAMQAGFVTEQYNHADDFLRHYNEHVDVIALDLMMPDIDGIELIRFLAEKQSNAKLVLISGFDSGVLHSAQELAIEQGLNVVGSLAKPFRLDELSGLLSSIASYHKPVVSEHIDTQFQLDELQHACDNDQLVVYYQPQIDLADQRVCGLEALVRWQHPRFGLVPPSQFLPLVEQSDLIEQLTWCVLELVMRQSQQWQNDGIDMRIAVNMSARVLKDLELPDKIDQLVLQKGLTASRLILEVTETALMDELAKSLDILTRLRIKDFHLSIDDFGTGYSSMVQLHRAPFSEIKVDQSFVVDMEKGQEARAIVETIIMLAHKLGMKAVAEGVESEIVLQQLIDMGCDIAQGYYIARPMPAEFIADWIQHRN